MTSPGRPARAPRPDRLSIGRALLGAVISVAGVLLGIGSLLLLSDPSAGPGPTVSTSLEDSPGPGAVVSPAPTVRSLSAAPAPPAESSPSTVASVARSAAPASPAAAPNPTRTSARPQAPRADPLVVPVTVLNNSRLDGLADRAAARFRRGGWPVRETGNFRGRVPVTTVYYDPGDSGQRASAQAFARRFDGIARVRPRFDTLPARGVVVVLTSDYES